MTSRSGNSFTAEYRLVISAIISLAVVAIIALVANRLLVPAPREAPPVRRVPAAVAKPFSPPASEVVIPSSPATAENGDSGHVSVLLVDTATGERVSGGTVSLTTERGTVDLPEVEVGQYDNQEIRTAGRSTLRARADGYETAKRCYERLSPDFFPLTIELVPWSTLRLVAKSEDGTPLVATAVFLTLSWRAAMLRSEADGMDPIERFQKPIEGTTDPAGVAVFAELPFGGHYAVEVHAEGKGTIRKDRIELYRGKTTDVEVTLLNGATLFGYTIDSSGVRAGGYSVKCHLNSYKDPGKGGVLDLEAHAVSDAAGEFRFDSLLPGWKRVVVSSTSPGRIEVFGFEITLKPGEAYDCGGIGPLSLASGGVRLGVTVADEEGNCVPMARVLIIGHSYPHMVLRGGSTDEHGRFDLLGFSPGRLSLRVQAPNVGVPPREEVSGETLSGSRLGIYSNSYTLRPGQEEEIAVLLPYLGKEPQGGEVLIRLRDAGAYVSGNAAHDFVLCLRDRDGYGVRSFGLGLCKRVEPDAYTLFRVDKRVYSIIAIGEGKVGETTGIIVDDNDQQTEVEIVLEKGVEMRGRVRDKETGRGIQAFVQRTFGIKSGYQPPPALGTKPVTTRPSGEFVVSLFRPNELGRLNVWAFGYNWMSVEVTGTVGEIVDILLEPKR